VNRNDVKSMAMVSSSSYNLTMLKEPLNILDILFQHQILHVHISLKETKYYYLSNGKCHVIFARYEWNMYMLMTRAFIRQS